MGEKTDKVRFGLTGGTIRTEILRQPPADSRGLRRHRRIRRGGNRLPVRPAAGLGKGKNLQLVRVEEDSAVLTGKIEEVAYR